MIDINELRAKTLEVQQRDKAREVKRLTETYAELIKDTERRMHEAAKQGNFGIAVANLPPDARNALWVYFTEPFKKKLEASGRSSTIIISWEP